MQDSEREKKIKEFVELCKKCDLTHIYNPSTGICINRRSEDAKYLSKEIEFCNKYYKNPSNRGTEYDIINSIKNIKIPKGMINNENPVKIEDYIKSYNNSTNKIMLSELLNIKGDPDDPMIKNLNMIPDIVYTVYQMSSSNPEIYEYIKKTISQIFNTVPRVMKNIIYYNLSIFLNNGISRYIVNTIANLPIKAFFKYMIQFVSILSNISIRNINSSSVNRIAETGVYSKISQIPSSYESRRSQNKFKYISETDADFLQRYFKDAYNETSQTVNLSTIGLNLADVAKSSITLNFGYDDIKGRLYVIIIPSTTTQNIPRKNTYIYNTQERIIKLNEYIFRIDEYLKEISKNKDKIDRYREMYRMYLSKIDKERQIGEISNLLEKYKDAGESYTKKNFDLLQSLKETRESLQTISKKISGFTPSNEYIKVLDINYRNVSEKGIKLNKLREAISDKTINVDNLNYYIDMFDNLMKGISDLLNELRKIDENTIPKIVAIDIGTGESKTTVSQIPQKGSIRDILSKDVLQNRSLAQNQTVNDWKTKLNFINPDKPKSPPKSPELSRPKPKSPPRSSELTTNPWSSRPKPKSPPKPKIQEIDSNQAWDDMLESLALEKK